jgi:hypothetical protein
VATCFETLMTLTVLESPYELNFSFEEMIRYHGGHSPGGVAHAYKVLERALPMLDGEALVERRELVVDTSFGGPGARDGFELVTRAVSDGRYRLDASLARPELGLARERFVFVLRYRSRAVTLVLRDGFVSDDFIALTRTPDRTAAQEALLTAMKSEMAARVMAAPAVAAYDAAWS